MTTFLTKVRVVSTFCFLFGAAASPALLAQTPATVTLSNLVQVYDGTGKSVSTVTDPAGLTVDVTYNGSSDLPTNVGTYAVVGMIDDPNYTGGATNTMTISCPTVAVSGDLPGGMLGLSYLQSPTNRTWTPTGSTVYWHYMPICCLMNDGRVFAAAGYRDTTDNAQCEIYNPSNGQWTATSAMVEGDFARGYGFSATALPNGKVLIFGGGLTSGKSYATEIYDPATDSWETVATPDAAVRAGHSATLLQNGKVLMAGGIATENDSTLLKTAWIFNPDTGAWTQTGSMHDGHVFHYAVPLLDGKVLMLDNGANGDTAEIYDPAIGKFSVAPMPDEANGPYTLLPNGSVLAAGGANEGTVGELFDPATGTWRPTGSLHFQRWNASATLMQNGQVLIFGGTDEFNNSVSATEVYDPATEIWTPAGSSDVGIGTVVTLNDGAVLGFGDGSAAAELFGAVAVHAAGSDGPATFAMTDGALPRGMTLTSSGILEGAPVQLGDFSFTVTATDAFGCVGAGTLSMRVKSPVNIAFSNVTQIYDGNPKPVTITTDPPGLNVTVLYDGSSTAPSETGEYQVVAVVDDANYSGSASTKLSINCSADLTHAIPFPTLHFGSNFSIALGGVMEGSATSVQRQRHTVTKLQDGRFLVAGGTHVFANSEGGDSESVPTSEILDPNTGLWTTPVALSFSRGDHCAALLNDGRVLIAGGRTALDYHWWLQTADIYDPVSNKWTFVPALMATNHPCATATTLPDGKVLVAGGGTSELFDPATARWGSLTTMNAARDEVPPGMTWDPPIHPNTAILLPNGKVIVIGFGSAEIYDPAANAWTLTSPMHATESGTATLLADGTVLVIAGSITEIYDPATDTWTQKSSPPFSRTTHSATILPNGKILVEGGEFGVGDALEFYDVATDTWTTGEREIPWRQNSIGELLPSGAVLFIGGQTWQGQQRPCSMYVPIEGVGPFSFWASLPSGMAVTNDGSGPPNYSLAGLPESLGTITIPVTVKDWNGLRTCLTFSMTTVPSGAATDATAPTVAITNPKLATTIVTSPFLNITGSAADQGGTGVALVIYSLNGGAEQVALTTNRFTNWYANAFLNFGLNTLRAQSFDFRGNASAVATYNITYQWYSALYVITHGLGTVSIHSGTRLAGNHTYSINAMPGRQQIFSNWVDNASGAPLTSSKQCTFMMKSNLTLVANFVPDQVAINRLNGKYNGLFFETNGIAERSAGGIFNLAVKPNRTYSGKLCLAGSTYTVTGTFDVSGNDAQTITRSAGAVTVSLHMDFTGLSKQITGTVSCAAENWSAPLVADLAVFGGGNPYPAHRCTMAIPPADDAPTNSPSGYGYGLIRIPANGTLNLAGKLADGTAFSQSVPISKDGNAPIYCDLYNHRGLIAGWISFTSGHPVGTLTWIAPANSVAGYASGFNKSTAVIGITYAPLSPALNLPSANLDIAAGFGIESPLHFKVIVGSNNSITKDPSASASLSNPTNSVSGKIQTATGLISLKYRPTGATQDRTAFGLALQGANCAYGAFSTPSAGGAISLH